VSLRQACMKEASGKAHWERVLARTEIGGNVAGGLYARVCENDKRTLAMQNRGDRIRIKIAAGSLSQSAKDRRGDQAGYARGLWRSQCKGRCHLGGDLWGNSCPLPGESAATSQSPQLGAFT
jgi:hypothetical protein